ncbi:hypothetical protein [Flavobacterium sp.]|uniref:hypothetical protein n=1 Tax=Flavobacterium sp. TaxID=239 RepID=UPI002636DB33|nr:hypothetical protein [Flavobacterium sp.]MDG2433782.1 hypothetical protein [Flavobacterium sp.]
MKPTICATLLLLSTLSFAQSSQRDYLVSEEKDTVFCKIIALSEKRVEYHIEDKKSSSKKNIYNFLDLNITDVSVIENPLGIKIEQPEKGYAHVYLYRPYVYTGSALNCKVEYNGSNLVNLKTQSYYLHKVKANEIHKYNWVYSDKTKVEINAKEGEVYFIRGSFASAYQPFNTISKVANGMNIFLDNPKIARYMVLTMKKESPTY